MPNPLQICAESIVTLQQLRPLVISSPHPYNNVFFIHEGFDMSSFSRRVTHLVCCVIACLMFLPTEQGSAAPDVASSPASTPDNTAIPDPLEVSIRAVITPLMAQYDIPGMAVGLSLNGTPHIFAYGMDSPASRQPVNADTLFEVGSVSKLYTATLVGYAQALGTVTLSDPASRYLPALKGSAFDAISLMELGTYTAGGLPLQFPETVRTKEDMLAYYALWRPLWPAGTRRLYSNPSIGLMGYLAAQSLQSSFTCLMEQILLPKLGLTHTVYTVPPVLQSVYAFGSSKSGEPVRVSPGVLDAEAYGVKTTVQDLLRFVELHLQSALGTSSLELPLKKALATTQMGYVQVNGMTQGLGWEMYNTPTTLDRLLAGNSSTMSYEPQNTKCIIPPLPPREQVLLNKTGSTGGFGAYVLALPQQRLGLVLLANKNYPNEARIKAAWNILASLGAVPN